MRPYAPIWTIVIFERQIGAMWEMSVNIRDRVIGVKTMGDAVEQGRKMKWDSGTLCLWRSWWLAVGKLFSFAP